MLEMPWTLLDVVVNTVKIMIAATATYESPILAKKHHLLQFVAYPPLQSMVAIKVESEIGQSMSIL